MVIKAYSTASLRINMDGWMSSHDYHETSSLLSSSSRHPHTMTTAPSASTSISRDAAQLRVDQIESFRRELERLRGDLVAELTPAQQEAVTAYHQRIIQELTTRYGADASDHGKQLSLGMRLVSLVGAASLGSAVFLIFYHFWFAFGLALQEIILSAAPFLTFALALFIREKDPTGYFSRLSAALCYSCFVLNVVIGPSLLGINLGATQVLAGTVFAFILSYGLTSRLLLGAALIGVLTYVAALLTEATQSPWWMFFSHPDNFFLPAVMIASVPALLSQRRYQDFGLIYRTFGTLVIFTSLLVLGTWPSLSYFNFDLRAIKTAYQVATVIGVQVGIVAGVRYGLPELTLLSSLAGLVFIFQQACIWLFAVMPPYAFFSMMSVIAVGGLYVLKTIRDRLNAETLS